MIVFFKKLCLMEHWMFLSPKNISMNSDSYKLLTVFTCQQPNKILTGELVLVIFNYYQGK